MTAMFSYEGIPPHIVRWSNEYSAEISVMEARLETITDPNERFDMLDQIFDAKREYNNIVSPYILPPLETPEVSTLQEKRHNPISRFLGKIAHL